MVNVTVYRRIESKWMPVFFDTYRKQRKKWINPLAELIWCVINSAKGFCIYVIHILL